MLPLHTFRFQKKNPNRPLEVSNRALQIANDAYAFTRAPLILHGGAHVPWSPPVSNDVLGNGNAALAMEGPPLAYHLPTLENLLLIPSTKMFVGGLSQLASQEGLQEFFQQFGDIKECFTKTDIETRSRGFAFVTFFFLKSIGKFQ